MFLVVILALFATSTYPALSRGVVQTRTRLQAQTMATSVATHEGADWLSAQSLWISYQTQVDPDEENFSKTYTAQELLTEFGWEKRVTQGKVVTVDVRTEVHPGVWNKRAVVVASVTWQDVTGEQRAECEFRVAPQGQGPVP